MKSYTITVNGTEYQVTVEENAASRESVSPLPPTKKTITNVPGAGNIKVTTSLAGKIIKVEAKYGQTVNAGDTMFIIEAMKMEMPVVAPQAGRVASIEVLVGQSVEVGDILATMN